MVILQKPGGSDFTWDAVDTAVWTCIEVSSASISCNIPATTSVFVRIVRYFRPKTMIRKNRAGYVLSQRPRERYTKFGSLGVLQNQIYGLGSLGFEPGHVVDIRGGKGSVDVTSSGLSLVRDMTAPGVISVRHDLKIEAIDLKQIQEQ